MNPARFAVLGIALAAGTGAAFLMSGGDPLGQVMKALTGILGGNKQEEHDGLTGLRIFGGGGGAEPCGRPMRSAPFLVAS